MPDPGQGSLDLMQRTGVMPALGQAPMANLRRGKLIARALLDLGRPDPQQPQVIERAEAFLGLEEQENGIPPHGLGQKRLHVPGVGDHHIIRLKLINRPAISRLDSGHVPARLVKFQWPRSRPAHSPATRPMPQAG